MVLNLSYPAVSHYHNHSYLLFAVWLVYPSIQLALFSNILNTKYEVNSNRIVEIVGETIFLSINYIFYCVSHQHTWFPNSWIPYYQYFQMIITILYYFNYYSLFAFAISFIYLLYIFDLVLLYYIILSWFISYYIVLIHIILSWFILLYWLINLCQDIIINQFMIINQIHHDLITMDHNEF